VEGIVFSWKCSIVRRGRKGGVWDREKAAVQEGVAEVADGGKGRQGRDKHVIGSEGVGREAGQESESGPELLGRPVGESRGEEDI
jgi:hypothetical protein